MLLPKEADFPLLIKLSFNCPFSQHKGRGRIPARCFNGLMLDPGGKDFINPKRWIWVLSMVFPLPSQLLPLPFQTSFFCAMIQVPREECEAQGHSLPLVFDGDQNCKSIFGYWLLSINARPDYNEGKESTLLPPINLQGLIFTYQHSNNTDSHSRRAY